MYEIYTIQYFIEPLMRIELMTSSLPRKCSTPELQWRRAEDRARTGHLQLGRLSLYHMSYFRNTFYKEHFPAGFVGRGGFEPPKA